jgi:uncharacterized membrane protein
MFFIVHLLAMILAALDAMFFPIASMLFVLGALLIVVVQPFKANVHHLAHITTMFLLLLALWCVSVTGVAYAHRKREDFFIPLMWFGAVTGTLPLLYISSLILHWIYRHKKFGLQMIETIAAWKRGYGMLV